ncbi:MAG TPA: sigma factor [Gemmatimonadaceae bacterium]|nr:sigma factor [Gemmatimonadaceae bacterium]
MGVTHEPFPATRYSVIAEARDPNDAVRARAYGTLVAAYWKPVYKYVRIRWRAEPADAEDLTQAFFAHAYEKNFFSRYDPARARFRTYLRTCLDGFIANEIKAAGRLKRGGHARFIPLELANGVHGANFVGAEGELRAHDEALLAADVIDESADVEQYFHREWVRALFAHALGGLRALCDRSGRRHYFAVFERYDLVDDPERRPSYAALAAELALTTTQVTNYLAFTRREFRRLVLERLRAMSGSDEEFRAEARELLGADPRELT